MFVAGLPIIAVALVATLFIKELPLRTVAFADIEGDVPEPDDAESNGKKALLRSGLTVAYCSSECVEGAFSEVRLIKVLRTSHSPGPTPVSVVDSDLLPWDIIPTSP